MIEFGRTLRAAREAKGLTVEQLAKATRMLSRVVNDLENEDFSHLPAPIYGRGFVKLYCEEVGIDPKPMVAEFMELLNGRRNDDGLGHPTSPAPIIPAPIKPASVQPEPATAAVPPPAPTVEQTPADDLFSMPAARQEPVDEPAPVTMPIPPAPEQMPESATVKTSATKTSRYAAAYGDLLADDAGTSWAQSPSIWRWAVVGVVAIVFVVLVALGLRALYRATSATPTPIDDTTAAALDESEKAAEPKQAAAKARTKAADEPRTPMDIPSLYID